MTLITDEKSNTSLIKICYQRSQDVGVRNKVSLTVTVRKTPDDEQIVCTNVNMCDIRNRLESLEQTVFDLMKKKIHLYLRSYLYSTYLTSQFKLFERYD